MATLNEAWNAGEAGSIDDAAEAMKAAARARIPTKTAKVAAAETATAAVEKPPRVVKQRKPRAVKLPAESGAVLAIRREITGHEREIKRLAKALRALGAA